jgi:hypothetical protein
MRTAGGLFVAQRGMNETITTAAGGVVLVYLSRLGTPMLTHERVTLETVAKTIARIKDWQFDGRPENPHQYFGDTYFVPDDTLMLDEALRLGIRCPNALFGGVVPHPFVKTKAITHQLVDSSAVRPDGWSPRFVEMVRNAVLSGYTVFSARDAHVAATRMLPGGPIRLKRPLACGGRAQTLVGNADELDAFLEQFPRDEMAACGLVLESNLRRVITLSIGQITIGDVTVTYHGSQRAVNDNEGRSTYGGSDLVCVRGGWEALDDLPLTANVRTGIAQARLYEQAMSEYPGYMASRRNYDVGQGIDAQDQWRSGVFESSWRTGGASTAELAALAAFMQDPALQVVQASSVKEFGPYREAPRDAVVHFRGDDPQDGPIIRYTVVRPTSGLSRNPYIRDHSSQCRRHLENSG